MPETLEFPCPCGHRFCLGPDSAGSEIQCPDCARLVSVPSLSEYAALQPDGTYIVAAHAAARVAAPASLPAAAPAPRYDPLTGLLIRPVELAAPSVAATAGPVPVAAVAVDYAVGDRQHGRLVSLLTLPNFAVIIIVWAVVFLDQFVPGLLQWIIWPLILAHFGCVMEDLALFNHDELPRPLRNLSFHEDVWDPFIHVSAALVICYLPLSLLMDVVPDRWAMIPGLVVALGGAVLLPAVLLTATTSGSAANLRPDRLLAVIVRCGSDYLLLVLLWILCAAAMGLAFASVDFNLLARMFKSGAPLLAAVVGLHMVLTGIGVTGLHLLCWRLAYAYHLHYEQFPWIHQKHEPTPPPA